MDSHGVNVQLPIPFYIPSLSWLGHQATHFAKVALWCVSWSVFPFVYVALFPGVIISGGTWAHSWLLIIFPAVLFYSFSISWSFMRETQGGLLCFTDNCPKGMWEWTKLGPKGLWVSSPRTMLRASYNFWGRCYGASGMLSISFPSHSQVCLAGGLSLHFISIRKIGS